MRSPYDDVESEPTTPSRGTRRRGGMSTDPRHHRRSRVPPRQAPPPPARRGRRPKRPGYGWHLAAAALQVAALLAVPAVLGVAFGFFELNPKQAEMLAPVGSEAHLLLEPFPDDQMTVEIAYSTLVGPPPGASVATLFDQLNATCQKTTLRLDLHAFAGTNSVYGLSDLLALEGQLRQHWPVWGTMSLFVLYLNGEYAPHPGTLGTAFRGSAVAVFESRIVAATLGVVTATAVTTAVLLHEVGRDLGLVGLDGYAANEDPHHAGYASGANDVMYAGIDTSGYVANLTAPPPSAYSSADLADLRNVRAAVIPYEILPWATLAGAVLAAAVVLWLARTERAPPTKPPA